MAVTKPLPGPPDGENRLFIGGLSAQTTPNCIASLLQPFGRATDVQLNKRGFAHVTYAASEDGAPLERVITALNRTTWRNCELRLQRATEHYMVRLRREWEAPASDLITEEKKKEDEDGNAQTEDKPVHFEWKGKHKRFKLTDDDDYQVDFGEFLPPPEKQRVKQPTFRSEKGTSLKQGSVNNKPKPSLSTSVTSTLSLFGVQPAGSNPLKRARSASSSAPTPVPKPKPNPKAQSEQPKHDVIIDMQAATEVERDAKLIDLSREKRSALGVLSAMFAQSDARSFIPNYTAFHMPALYRQLALQGEGGKGVGAPKNEFMDKVINISGERVPLDEVRRKGLYRKLVKTTAPNDN